MRAGVERGVVEPRVIDWLLCASSAQLSQNLASKLWGANLIECKKGGKKLAHQILSSVTPNPRTPSMLRISNEAPLKVNTTPHNVFKKTKSAISASGKLMECLHELLSSHDMISRSYLIATVASSHRPP